MKLDQARVPMTRSRSPQTRAPANSTSQNWRNRVQQFSSEGTFIAAFGSSGSGNGQLSGPARR